MQSSLAPSIRVLRDAAWVAGYVVLYVLLDRAGYIQAPLNAGITAWSPEAGLTVAFLLLRGPRFAPWTALAALVAERVVHGNSGGIGTLVAASAWIGLVYGLMTLALRGLGVRSAVQTPAEVARLIGVAVPGALLVAAGYVAILIGSGMLPARGAVALVGLYFVGDVNGILIVAPLVLAAAAWPAPFAEALLHRTEFIAQLLLTAALAWPVAEVLSLNEHRYFYLLFIPVLWAGLRTGLAGALALVLVAQAGLAILVQLGRLQTPFIDMQCFVLTLSGAALALGASVSERKLALDRLAVSEAKQRQLLAAAPEPMLVVRPDGLISLFNDAARVTFGGRAPSAPLPSAARDLLPQLALSGSSGTAVFDAQRADGTRFPAEVTWTRLAPPATPGYLLVVHDLTERHRTEARQREQEQALREAINHATAGEVATALAHEINQPLTALSAYLQAAQILARQPESAQLLGTTLAKSGAELQRATRSLRRLQDIYQAGIVEPAEVDVAALCRRVELAHAPRLRDLGAESTLLLPPGLPAVLGNALHLEIALHNLVSNALDALQGATGRRELHLSAQASGPHVNIRVEDSGPGIPAAMAADIFEPNVTTKPDGMGLGLALSRSLIRAQGGDLTLEQPGTLGGACFILCVPLRPDAT